MKRNSLFFNDTSKDAKTVFLYSDVFMPGLKVLDAQQRELVLYSNEDTRRYLAHEEDSEAKIMLDQMNTRQLFVLWIRFPDDSIMHAGEPKIIKFVYHDNSTPSSSRGLDIFRKQRFLFSTPKFDDSYRKNAGERYDVFYIVKAPENDNIEYKIAEVSHGEGLHPNHYRHSISIRFPPCSRRVNFQDYVRGNAR